MGKLQSLKKSYQFKKVLKEKKTHTDFFSIFAFAGVSVLRRLSKEVCNDKGVMLGRAGFFGKRRTGRDSFNLICNVGVPNMFQKDSRTAGSSSKIACTRRLRLHHRSRGRALARGPRRGTAAGAPTAAARRPSRGAPRRRRRAARPRARARRRAARARRARARPVGGMKLRPSRSRSLSLLSLIHI